MRGHAEYDGRPASSGGGSGRLGGRSGRLARWVAGIGTVGLMAGALAACGTTPTVSKHLASVTLALDWTWESYHSPFMYALEKGWYKAAGISLTLDQGDGSTNTATLVGRGEYNMGFADTSTMSLVASDGIPVENVLGIDKQAAFGTECFKSVKFTRPGNLVGKTVEVTAGSSQAAVFPGYLALNHISPSGITVVSAEPSDEVTVFVEHKADCMIGEIGEDLLNASLESSAIGAPVPWSSSGVDLMGYGLVVSKAYASSHPALVKKVVAVTARAFRGVCSDQGAGLALFNRLHPQLALTKAERAYSSGQLAAVCAEMPAPKGVNAATLGASSRTQWSQSIAFLHKYAGLKHVLPTSEYYSNDFVG